MQKHTDLTRQRVNNFTDKLAELFYQSYSPVTLAVYSAPGRIPYSIAMQGDYRPAAVGEKFGPLWSTHWFRITFEMPSAWQGREVHLLWDSSSEACIWQDGVPLQGLTGSFNGYQEEPIRKEFILTKKARSPETGEYFIEIACNGMFGLDNPSHNPRTGELCQAEIALFNPAAWDLYWDLKIIADMAQHLPANTPRGGQALYTANEMVNTILLEDESTWQPAREIAARFLSARNGDGQHNLSAVGHAHIDTAWLWPIAEAKRKCVRSFSTAIRYMDEYPAYKYVSSQAQQFAWMKEAAPALFEKMKTKAQQGQFVPVGGTWVEPDCNIPCGESLVRQFLYGQRFFEAEFGQRCTEFWNPDVFGYSGALPQIMRLAGIEYFLTQKLSWNQFNKPASHTFLWEGIDGSRVLTHFPPADTYNAKADVKDVLFSLSNFKDHERANESYLVFGYGDGGGGPTPGMLEQLNRMGDVDGLPRTAIRPPHEFFARCAADLKDALVMVGELYLEYHRGTYTTQANNKKQNRRCEALLRDVEILSVLDLALKNKPYPADILLDCWQSVLTNQFHDIIPGSSIGEVYQDSDRDYEKILQQGAELRASAIHSLLPCDPTGSRIAAFNTLGFPRTEIVELPEGITGTQVTHSGKALGIIYAPSMGYAIKAPANTDLVVSIRETAQGFILENATLRAAFNHQGGLTSLFDKTTARESIEPGQSGNTFVLFEDLPNSFDAWDMDIFHLEKQLPVSGASSAGILESGPLRVSLAFEYNLSQHSTIKQIISLDALSKRLDFACEVDWHEKHKILKVEFPLNIRAMEATYEIQFGHVQRPTHYNTSYDMARFEVPAQKWADLSESDYGVALLNDCKYGYSVYANIMRLSLLRSPTNPDPDADQGIHEFRYAIFPHEGNPQSAGVVQEASRFNVPLLLEKTHENNTQHSFFAVDHPAIILDTIKKAEDSDAIILRLYESRGTRGKVNLSSSLPIKSAALVNLLEDEISPLECKDGVISIDFRPFEIVSVRIMIA